MNTQKSFNWIEKTPVFVVVLAFVLCLAYWFAFKALPFGGPDSWGQFGDYLGGILNPIVGLCTLLVALTVWQSQQKELEATLEMLEQQTRTNQLQQFENTFFKLAENSQRSIERYSVTQTTPAFSNSINSVEAIKLALDRLNAADYLANMGSTDTKCLDAQDIEAKLGPINGMGFYQPYTAIKHLLLFADRKCPIPEKSMEYVEMVQLLHAHEVTDLCRYWAIANQDTEMLALLPPK
jgi:hypothetical protein